jgi:23S rRNA (cytidine2498-2'-O)-methyltransferase
VLQCRVGFELECAEEARTLAVRQGHEQRMGERRAEGHVVLELSDPAGPAALSGALTWDALAFTRQLFWSRGAVEGLARGDRVEPLVEAARALEPPFESVLIEHPDGPAGRPLARLCRGLVAPVRAALEREQMLARARGPLRLHLLMVDSGCCLPGVGDPSLASPWAMGIPRLRVARRAPSRSAMKLEEALATLLGEDAARLVRPGMRAVDVGASPGGWTWVLASRGLRVTAVDNGPLRAAALDAGRVEHLREDAFRYRPRRAVDWMTCDIADKPRRVAGLVARWLAEGWCRACVFNLKLPMRRRLEALDGCRAEIERALRGARIEGRLAFKQLYHDREEVTGIFRRSMDD